MILSRNWRNEERLMKPENKLHFYAKAEEFLAKHLGGRFEPIGEIKGHSGVAK